MELVCKFEISTVSYDIIFALQRASFLSVFGLLDDGSVEEAETCSIQ
jgi:hypothetical protein